MRYLVLLILLATAGCVQIEVPSTPYVYYPQYGAWGWPNSPAAPYTGDPENCGTPARPSPCPSTAR